MLVCTKALLQAIFDCRMLLTVFMEAKRASLSMNDCLPSCQAVCFIYAILALGGACVLFVVQVHNSWHCAHCTLL